jgi:hypothetical protein
MAIGEAIGKEEGIAIGEAIGKEEGIAIGEEKGRDLRNKELILKLYQKGKTANEISELLEIPLPEVQAVSTEFLKK